MWHFWMGDCLGYTKIDEAQSVPIYFSIKKNNLQHHILPFLLHTIYLKKYIYPLAHGTFYSINHIT